MDFETELGFYTMPFVLICFRLLLLAASLQKYNAPCAKISRFGSGHGAAGSGQRRGHFQSGAEGCRLCLPHTHISTPVVHRLQPSAEPPPPPATAAAVTGLQQKGEGGDGALLQGAVGVNTLSLLPPSYPEVLWLQRTQVEASVEALGGGWKTWKSSVEAR